MQQVLGLKATGTVTTRFSNSPITKGNEQRKAGANRQLRSFWVGGCREP